MESRKYFTAWILHRFSISQKKENIPDYDKSY